MRSPLKRGTRRSLPLEMRDTYGLSAVDRIELEYALKCFCLASKAHKMLRRWGRSTLRKRQALRKILVECMLHAARVLSVEHAPCPAPRVKLERVGLSHFDRATFNDLFRFRSPEDITRLLEGFKFPLSIKVHTYRFSREELVLVSLMRLAHPHRWSDIESKFPGRKRWELQRAFYWFLGFMITQWGYLLLNNRDYWVDYMQASAEAIRLKLANLPNERYRQAFPPAGQPEGFSVFGFIDNTITAMCRPGGALQEGEQAPRLDNDVQRAFYTGWKHLHGLKWQTVILANGMDMDVWGPASVRHNDRYTLNNSCILDKLENCQQGRLFKYKLYGDSAYSDSAFLVTGGGRGMSSVRETIEWSYKDLKTTWKYCDYTHCLKLRNQPLAKIIFVCMLLRNTHCCMYGSQSTDYFALLPPTFEEWISQGPRARPIPPDICFSSGEDGSPQDARNADVDEDNELYSQDDHYSDLTQSEDDEAAHSSYRDLEEL